MKKLLLPICIMILVAGCQSSKPNSQTKKGCNTCPSLSNEGKIDKPFKNKKKK